MILVGQYDLPYVRRVAVSLRVLGFAYERDTRSVFANFDAMREINPLGRIPSLVLDDSEVLIDSAAILDWLDQTVGPARTLLPPAGPARRRALRLIALATGAIDKVGAAAYERLIRPAALRWPEWTLRCRMQGAGALAALAAEPWPVGNALGQAEITTSVHAPLCHAGGSRAAAARAPSKSRCAVRAREALRNSRRPAGRIRGPAEPLRVWPWSPDQASVGPRLAVGLGS